MKNINYAHNFQVKFDRVLVFAIKTWGWSMAVFLVWFLTSIFNHHEKVALKFAPLVFRYHNQPPVIRKHDKLDRWILGEKTLQKIQLGTIAQPRFKPI